MAIERANDILVRTDGEHGRDRDEEACRSLWAAVIHKAVKDVAYVDAKRQQPGLTPSEREKLHRIHELDTPESFFHGIWFEEICRYLELPAARIRSRVLELRPAL